MALELPDFPWDALAPYARSGARASGRHRRPLGRLARRPDARPSSATRWPPRPTRTPTRRPPGIARAARGDRRLVRAAPRRRRPDGRERASRRSARRSSSRCCRRCSGSARATSSCMPTRRLPDLRGRRGRRRRDGARIRRARRVAGRDAARLAQQPRQPRRPGARRRVPAARPCVRARELGAVDRERRVLRRAQLDRATSRRPSILDPRVIEGDATPHARRCTRSASSRTSPATGPDSSRAAATSSASCSPVRKHLGLIPPAPVQAAMIAALGDDAHVAVQRERYRARRDVLRAGARGGGIPDRRERRRAVPLGDPRRGRLGDGRGTGRARHPRRPRLVLRASGRAARAGRPHRRRDERMRSAGRSVLAATDRRPWRSAIVAERDCRLYT